MCLRPRLPQLPVHHKPPTLHPNTSNPLKRIRAELLVLKLLCLQGFTYFFVTVKACCGNTALPFLSQRFPSRHSALALVSPLFPLEDGRDGALYLAPFGETLPLANQPPPFCCAPRQAPDEPFCIRRTFPRSIPSPKNICL